MRRDAVHGGPGGVPKHGVHVRCEQVANRSLEIGDRGLVGHRAADNEEKVEPGVPVHRSQPLSFAAALGRLRRCAPSQCLRTPLLFERGCFILSKRVYCVGENVEEGVVRTPRSALQGQAVALVFSEEPKNHVLCRAEQRNYIRKRALDDQQKVYHSSTCAISSTVEGHRWCSAAYAKPTQ